MRVAQGSWTEVAYEVAMNDEADEARWCFDACIFIDDAGRLAMRIAFDSASEDLEVVHINDLASAESSAYLLQFDFV